jgi:hypothetical protein
LLESGVDIHTIQRLLGHGYITTTTRNFQLTRHTELGPDSPIDLLFRAAADTLPTFGHDHNTSAARSGSRRSSTPGAKRSRHTCICIAS